MIRRLFVASVATLSAGVSLAAQSSARVSGRVLDQTGAPLPGVAVELISHSRTHETVITSAAGTYRFDGAPSGSAELTFRLINFSVQRRAVNIVGTTPVIADIVLALSLSADVVVTGARTFRNVADVDNPAASLVGIASTSGQGAITAVQLEARPVMRARSIQSVQRRRRGHRLLLSVSSPG